MQLPHFVNPKRGGGGGDNLIFKTPSAIVNFDFKHAYAATTQPNIYDGNVENLIQTMSSEHKSFIGSELWGKNYFTSNGNRYCVLYYGENKNKYIGFRLNADNSVIYSYLGLKNIDLEEFNMNSLAGVPTLFIGLGLDAREYMDLWGQFLDYIDHSKRNNIEFVNKSETFYHFCRSINKKVYMKVRLEDSGGINNFYVTLGATN